MLNQPNLSVNPAGHLTIGGVDAVALAEKYGTPLYVLDEDMVRGQMALYREEMRKSLPPGSRPYFASKAMSCKAMYRIAKEEGIGADTVSMGEIYTAQAAGFPPEDICFHGCAKPWAEIEYAVKAGAGLFGVDSLEELARIDRCAGENGVRQRVLLRVTPGIDPHTFSAVDTGQVDCKFGEAIQTGQALALVRRGLASRNIQVAGFHCHIGSQIGGPEPLMQAVDIMLDFMDAVRRELGYTAGILDLGGGLGVPYTAEEPAVDYAAVIRSVGEHLTCRCQALDYPPPAVFMEPGRSIVAAAGVTLYTVQDVKSIPDCRDYVLVDGGMTDNPRYALYQARYTALIANRAGEPADCPVTLAGRCCESGDLIGENMPMQRAAVGDIAAVLVTGAYNYSVASNYNRIPRPPVVMVRNGEDRLVVRRETLEDLVSCDI